MYYVDGIKYRLFFKHHLRYVRLRGNLVEKVGFKLYLSLARLAGYCHTQVLKIKSGVSVVMSADRVAE